MEYVWGLVTHLKMSSQVLIIFSGMREEKPIPTFSYVISELNKRFPNFAYLHLVESGVAGNANQDEPQDLNKYLRPLWQPKPLIVAGRYQPETAIRTVEERDGLVAFGRWFISNVSSFIRNFNK